MVTKCAYCGLIKPWVVHAHWRYFCSGDHERFWVWEEMKRQQKEWEKNLARILDAIPETLTEDEKKIRAGYATVEAGEIP